MADPRPPGADPGIPHGYDARCGYCGRPFTFFNSRQAGHTHPARFCSQSCEKSAGGHDGRIVPAGTIFHLNGIPVELTCDAEFETTLENWAQIYTMPEPTGNPNAD